MTFNYLKSCCAREVRPICEKLTFNDMVGVSEKKRKERARGVTGPPVSVEAYNGTLYYMFNFKSLENTTGQRHKGYVKFYKPKNPTISLGKVDCDVDCTCPDFKYTWAWAIKQRGSATLGSNSLNKCVNRAPKIKNPRSVPGLCKHLLSLSKFIMNQTSSFPGTDDDNSTKLAKLIKKTGGHFVTPAYGEQKRVSSQALKARSQAKAAGIPFQKKEKEYEVQPVKLEPVNREAQAGTVPDNNRNQTNPTNESIFMSMQTLLTMKSLLEAEIADAEAQPVKKQDGLEILGSIRDTLADIKELIAKEENKEEDKEDTEIEKEAVEAPEPPKVSENPESKDKEV